MKSDYFKRVSKITPTGFWINNVTRQEAEWAVEAGAVGCTQNPSFPWKILQDQHESVYALEILDDLIKNNQNDEAVLDEFQMILIKNICETFKPMFEASGGHDGWVSIQGSPFKEDVQSIIDYAHAHRAAADNMIIKIPATKDGLDAMRILVKEGVPMLATEVMSVDQAMDVCDVYEEASQGMTNPPVMYMAHIAGIFDEDLQALIAKDNTDIDKDALWQAGIACAKKIQQLMDSRKSKVRLLSGGARGLHHFTEMVGARSEVTINWKGTADKLIEENLPVVQRFLAPTPYGVIDELCAKSEMFRKAYVPNSLDQEEYEHFSPVVRFRTTFEKAWTNCLAFIKERRSQA